MSKQRVIIVGQNHNQHLIGILVGALLNKHPSVEVIEQGDGVTVELHEGDICLVDTSEPVSMVEKLKALDVASLDLERELPLQQIGNHEGTAFYCKLKKYRRQDKRRAGKIRKSKKS
ncbi:MAG: hypothetical protein RLY66_224 [Candidatus Parcubacteria bacterium]|jgi:hypothetical protein